MDINVASFFERAEVSTDRRVAKNAPRRSKELVSSIRTRFDFVYCSRIVPSFALARSERCDLPNTIALHPGLNVNQCERLCCKPSMHGGQQRQIRRRKRPPTLEMMSSRLLRLHTCTSRIESSTDTANLSVAFRSSLNARSRPLPFCSETRVPCRLL